MYNRKAFKREAKQYMRASKPHYMLVALVYVLLTTGLSYLVTALTGGGTALTGTLSIFLNILVSLFAMVMGVGFANYALRLSRGQSAGVGSLFDAFSYAGRSIGMTLLVAVYTFLWSLLAAFAFSIVIAVAAAVLMDIEQVAGIIVMVIAYIALIIAVVAIALRYAMAPFALAEHPDDGAVEAIRRSVRMMRGYKRKLFVLKLSFIGWALLMALIVLAVMGAGIFASGMVWMFESLFAMGDDWMNIYSATESLLGQMTIWMLVAEVVCLPLTMWFSVYMQTVMARFYNFVGGYDYHRYMNESVFEENQQPVSVAAPEQPATSEETVEEPAVPVVPVSREQYYTSIVPSEDSEEEPEEMLEAIEEEEEN